jgi:hypothetical protein
MSPFTKREAPPSSRVAVRPVNDPWPHPSYRHVISTAGAWDDSGDLFIAEQELEKKLAPGGCVEVLGPVRQALAFNRPEQ